MTQRATDLDGRTDDDVIRLVRTAYTRRGTDNNTMRAGCRELRDRGMTRYQIADRTKVPQATLLRWFAQWDTEEQEQQ